MAIVLDLKESHATILTEDVYLGGACIDRVLNEFLKSGTWGNDNLARSNLVDRHVI